MQTGPLGLSFDWRGLTPPGIALGSPKGGGAEVVNIYVCVS
jgi:hypothetical protein